MQSPTAIPVASILVKDRARIDHSNTDGLKESLGKHGTIQPLIIEPLSQPVDGYTFKLIAGGRRLLFLTELGHTELFHGSVYDPKRPGYVLGAELTEDELRELELEENIRRKEMTWQERVLATADLHRLKVIRYGDQGESWSMRMTGELMGTSVGRVSYTVAAAELLRSSPDHALWKLDSLREALRWMHDQTLQRAMAEKARRQREESAQHLENVDIDSLLFKGVEEIDVDTSSHETQEKIVARERYLSNPYNDPAKFDEYWLSKMALLEERKRIIVTPRIHLGDSLQWLKQFNGKFDSIITDPPYAIDMNNLEQENVGMANIDSVRATHDVADNLKLLHDFFPIAFDALKENATMALWADYSMWRQLCDWGEAVGFKVQRWPVVWVKTHQCSNAAATFNFTKTTEIAVIFRKGNATLTNVGPLGHIIAGHDEYKSLMDHPFVKPFACWEHLITNLTLEGQLVAEPFAGQGSGVLSLLRCNRNYLASEKEEPHFNKLLENIKNEHRKVNPNAQFI